MNPTGGGNSNDSHLGDLFKACDLDGSGFIDQHELANACKDLSKEELREIFSVLDKDGDGRISAEEFAKGFKEIAEAMEVKNREKIRERLRSDSFRSTENLDVIGRGGGRGEGGEQVEEMYLGGLDEGLRALSW